MAMYFSSILCNLLRSKFILNLQYLFQLFRMAKKNLKAVEEHLIRSYESEIILE